LPIAQPSRYPQPQPLASNMGGAPALALGGGIIQQSTIDAIMHALQQRGVQVSNPAGGTQQQQNGGGVQTSGIGANRDLTQAPPLQTQPAVPNTPAGVPTLNNVPPATTQAPPPQVDPTRPAPPACSCGGTCGGSCGGACGAPPDDEAMHPAWMILRGIPQRPYRKAA
jgi:hypothetical protein